MSWTIDTVAQIKLGLLMERVTAERDWVTIADADEFHAYQGACDWGSHLTGRL